MTGTRWDVLTVTKVVDGDSLHVVRSRPVEIDGRHYRLTDLHPCPVRLAWVDTPERGQDGYREARNDLAQWITTHPGLSVWITESAGWDRLLGDLVDPDGNSASQWLMTERGWPAYQETR